METAIEAKRDTGTLREYFTDAIRYWEHKRILYNLILAIVVLVYFIAGLPVSRRSLSLDTLLFVFLLAVLANVAYCAAYIADVFAQMSGFRERWRDHRAILFVTGLICAGILTRFWAISIFEAGRR
jgi:hypothetical protein